MNKNHKRKVDAAHAAYSRVKRGRASTFDHALADLVGVKPPLDAHPKVGRSAQKITEANERMRGNR